MMKSVFPTLIVASVLLYFFWQNVRDIEHKQIEFGATSALAQKPESSGPKALTPNQVKKKEDEIRKQMLQISKDLGVTCSYCHNVSNWKEDLKSEWKIAAEHLKMVEAMRSFTMNGKEKINETGCYLCHRGEAKYKWRQ